MSSSKDADQGLYKEVHRRLVQSGEWDRIVTLLSQKLNENGWVDDMRIRGKEAARNMDSPKFQKLLEQIEPHAQSSVPLAIRQEIMVIIKQFLEKEFQ
ncbi:hypothetical protein M422DRAFT_177887 [Sphaerobolus stellatus SS14]|uniref:Transcription and mRNA export factor SUS1 n=1 Tax=Sphaerobolus stellatus (strain SS14) TaxID=990650 RepID=A0A0C9V7M4_SPHS4|nr:hypothetical protein M422DRAFT_177887 [Sphaerobolus stellatus SS14]